jgi:hypothetical protein
VTDVGASLSHTAIVARASGRSTFTRDCPGPLSGDQHADAVVVADVAARWVLEVQAAAP